MTAEAMSAGVADDFLFVDKPDSRRALIGMPGHYMMDRWRDADGKKREFPCSIVKMTPQAVVFTASVSGGVGEWTVVRFGPLGQFEGPLIQVTKRSLGMRIVATLDERNRVAAKIAWLENKLARDGRRFERFVPPEPYSAISLTDGRVLSCTVIDYSICGAAVFVDETLPLGTPVKVGAVPGRVVRHFGGGFAVNFGMLQHPEEIISLLELSTTERA